MNGSYLLDCFFREFPFETIEVVRLGCNLELLDRMRQTSSATMSILTRLASL
jgi:hypothetical protein